jgi:hypothetical protein
MKALTRAISSSALVVMSVCAVPGCACAADESVEALRAGVRASLAALAPTAAQRAAAISADLGAAARRELRVQQAAIASRRRLAGCLELAGDRS